MKMLLLDCKQRRDEEQFSSVLQGNIKNKQKQNKQHQKTQCWSLFGF